MLPVLPGMIAVPGLSMQQEARRRAGQKTGKFKVFSGDASVDSVEQIWRKGKRADGVPDEEAEDT